MTSQPDPHADPQGAAAIQSMTGSGTAVGETEFGRVTVECRSVNSRGLLVKTRLANECQGLEAALETYVRSRLTRGTVHVVVAAEPTSAPEPTIDVEFAAKVAEHLEALAARIGKIGETVAFADVLGFPGVVPTLSRSGPRPSRELPDDLRALVTTAMDELIASRQLEGAATTDAMRTEIDNIEAELAAVQEHAPSVIARYREKLLQRVNEFLEGRATTMEDKDVIREVSMFADRVDITEECQRLASHISKARDLLVASGPVGRNVEFLVQEMLREVNTLGSKSPDVAISHRVVAMKSSIDKLKEQAANLQ